MEDRIKAMPALENVTTSYSGKIGCMCGCNGKYKYAVDHVRLSGKHRGYDVSEDEISNRSVKIIYNKIKRAFEEGKNVITGDKSGDNINYAYFEPGNNRCWAIYFIDK